MLFFRDNEAHRMEMFVPDEEVPAAIAEVTGWRIDVHKLSRYR